MEYKNNDCPSLDTNDADPIVFACKSFVDDIDKKIDAFRASLRPGYIATIYCSGDNDMCIYTGKHLAIHIAIPSGNLISLNELLHPQDQDDIQSKHPPE